ncbi:hypothetical protein Syun_015633 [Stephania yunnanensis]|uniref:Uncharacterized protein n=1 Tax=Stephania yunnanensis TaxID=152371 RepID=A0AAP0JLJ0_9MAGN
MKIQKNSRANGGSSRGILKKVIGDEKRGRVLTYGHGPSFKDVFGKDSECSADIAIRRAQEKANATNELLREELATTKTNMQSQIDTIYACLEKAEIQLPNNVYQTSDVGISHRPHVQTSSHD